MFEYKRRQQNYGLALINDRISAFLLDLAVLVPVVQLLQAPIRRLITESLLYNHIESVVTLKIINAFVFIAVFSAYNIFCTYRWGQTLGKHFFKIRIISYQGKISFLTAFIRVVFQWFEALCFGFPLLGLWLHPLRRPLHDRAADTVVISEHERALPLQMMPPLMTKSWLIAIVFFIGLVPLSFLWVAQDPIKNKRQASNESCEDFDDASLEESLHFFIVEKITPNCLKSKAQDLLWKQEESTLASIAMAFANMGEPRKSDRYLKQACQEGDEFNDELCLFVNWMWDVKSPFSEELWNYSISESAPDFTKVILAAHLRKDGNYQRSLNILDSIDKNTILKKIVFKMSFHDLLGLERWQEAQRIMKITRFVNEEEILHYMVMELQSERKPNGLHLVRLIEFFYPDLKKHPNLRLPASISQRHPLIDEIYHRSLRAR